MHRAAGRFVVLAIEWVSVRIHDAIFRDVSMSLCARAWWMQDHRFWAVWMTVFDTLLHWYEPGHCEASYRRCWGWKGEDRPEGRSPQKNM